jgi:hypothetical protein
VAARFAEIRKLSAAENREFVQSLLRKSQEILYHPANGVQPLAEGTQPVYGNAAFPLFNPYVQRQDWTWDWAPNWSASVPDSAATETATFIENGRENAVFTNLVYKWTMSGGALVWPETLNAAGQWFNGGPVNGMPMSQFDGHFYRGSDSTASNTFDRMVQMFEAQARIRWKTQVAGTVQAFHMDGSTTMYIPPPELPADGRVPRVENKLVQTIAVGLPGWRHIGIENKKSSGLLMPVNSVNGAVPANQNTGVNGGDRVTLSIDGIIAFRTNGGFYQYVSAPDYLRILFEPADGSPPRTLYPFNFPLTFTQRGSLYFYLDKPSWDQWTATFERGGYVVLVQIDRSPDSDNDGLTDYEEIKGIAGWKSKKLRFSDPKKTDTDGDTISDFDEVFGWNYVDRRTGQKLHADDTDPSKPDEFYARQYLRNATFFKYKFRKDRNSVSYSNAIAYFDNDAEKSMQDAFTVARVLASGGGPQGVVLLDAVHEKTTLELLRSQDHLQKAFEARLIGDSEDAISRERAELSDAIDSYESGIRTFYGRESTSSVDNALASFSALTKQLEPSRVGWDIDAGDDPNLLQPFQEAKNLSKLLAGRLEAVVRDAALYNAEADSRDGDPSALDQGRQLLVRGLARAFVGQAVLEDLMPASQFDPTNGPVEVAHLLVQIKAAENRASVLDRGVTNSLGFDPGLVRFAFNPENDPAAVGDNPNNNFKELMSQLNGKLGSLTLAKQREIDARSEQRSFESESAQFEQARLQNQIVYDQQLTTYQMGFDAAKTEANIATEQVAKARNELTNIYARIQIEQERVARKQGLRYEVGQEIAQVFMDTGEALAANEYALGEINATDAELQGFIQMMSSSSVSAGYPSGFSVNFNPGQMIGGMINSVWGPYAARERAALAAANQRIQALEKARVQMLNVKLDNQLEQADSEAHVKSMLLETANASIDVRIRLLEACDAISRMQKYAQLIQETQVKQREADQLVKNLFGDPSYRLIRDHLREKAETLSEQAREDVYFAGKALEYETTWKSKTLPRVFVARSATELEEVAGDLQKEWNGFVSATTARVPTPVRISLREDILGFKYGPIDPTTGKPIDMIKRFQEYLKSIATGPEKKSFRIEFYGSLNEWLFPGTPNGLKRVWPIPRAVFDTKIQWISVALCCDAGPGRLGDEAAVVSIELDGPSWVRSSQGTVKPPPDAPNPWDYGETVIRNDVARYSPGASGPLYAVPQRYMVRTIPVKVGQSGQEFRFWGLFDLSPVRKWAITLNLKEGGNEDINLDALEDIEIQLLLRSYDLPDLP